MKIFDLLGWSADKAYPVDSKTSVGRFALVKPASTGVTGTLAATETGADTAAASGQVYVKGTLAATEAADSLSASGKVYISGTLSATETGADGLSASGKVYVAGAMAAAETGTDTATATGKVLVKGTLAGTEVGSDTAAASGRVYVRGALAATEIGQDTSTASGRVYVKGTLSATETGADTAAASGKVITKGTLAATEVGSDTASAYGKVYVRGVLAATEQSDVANVSGTVANGFVITGAQALLIFKLYQLHGLSGPLTVSPTSRSVGDIVQSVTDASGIVTVATTSFGSDGLSGSVGTMIEELAKLHGLGANLEVTATTRTAGAVSQTMSTSGGTTQVVRI